MPMVHQEVIEYILAIHQNILDNLSKKVMQNYKDRMKQTIKLISSSK